MVRIRATRSISETLSTHFELEGKADEVGTHLWVSRGISDFCGAIRHRADRSYLEHELERASRAVERAVVVTHHAPSARSIRPWFKGDPLNPAFASKRDGLIEVSLYRNVRVEKHLLGVNFVVALGDRAQLLMGKVYWSATLFAGCHLSLQRLNTKYRSNVGEPADRCICRTRQWAREVLHSRQVVQRATQRSTPVHATDQRRS